MKVLLPHVDRWQWRCSDSGTQTDLKSTRPLNGFIPTTTAVQRMDSTSDIKTRKVIKKVTGGNRTMSSILRIVTQPLSNITEKRVDHPNMPSHDHDDRLDWQKK